MALLLPPENEGSFETVPAGTHIATCYRIIDMGTQLNKKFNKQEHKLYISFEFTQEKMSDGRPFTKQERFTLSSGKKSNLRPFLEAWRGVPFSKEEYGTFDLGKLIGKSAMIGILHNTSDGRTYDNISSIMRLPKGMDAPPLVNETVYFSLSDFKQEVFDKLSQNLRDAISKSPEYMQHMKPKNEHLPDDSSYGSHMPDDEIPF